MDGLFIENNQDLISELVSSNFEIEILSYNGNYSKKEFSKVIDILSEITIPKYCYAPYSDKEILNVCSSLSLHTIIPSINTTSNSYNDIKKKITNGSIISLQNKDYVLNELGTIIKYIKQKGYDIVTLDELLDESIIETTQE